MYSKIPYCEYKVIFPMADWQQQRDDNCKHMDGCCLWSLETDFFIHKILNLFIFWKCIMLRDSTFMKEIKIKSLFFIN